MSEFQNGDKVRVTASLTGDYDVEDGQVYTSSRGYVDVNDPPEGVTVELIERADDPANDPIGTIRDTVCWGPAIKMRVGVWATAGNKLAPEDTYLATHGDRWGDLREIIGAIPGTPAADDPRVAPAEPKVVHKSDPEPPRDARYLDRDGDVWFYGEHKAGRTGWGFDFTAVSWDDEFVQDTLPWTLVED